MKKKYTAMDKIKAIGPGAMITASFIGPGTITTATRAGTDFGYALIWVVIFSVIATIVLHEMVSRLGVVTQDGLGEAILKEFDSLKFKKLSAYLIGSSIFIGCASYISGDLIGTSLGLSSIVGITPNYIAPFIGIIVLCLVYKGSMKLLEKILTFLVGVMAFVFVTTMIVANPNWAEISKGIVPNFPKDSILVIISLIGTTVVPYNFFIHAAAARDTWKDPDEIELSKWDTYISITVGGIITAAVVITSATLMKGFVIKSAADISVQLEPLLGNWAKIFMGIGLFSAGLSSAIASPLGASYTLAGLFGWKYSNDDKRFKTVNIVIVIIGIIVNTFKLDPIQILLVAQALNGIILPLVTIYVVYITSSKRQMGTYKNSTSQICFGIIVSLISTCLGMYALYSAIVKILSML